MQHTCIRDMTALDLFFIVLPSFLHAPFGLNYNHGEIRKCWLRFDLQMEWRCVFSGIGQTVQASGV